MIRRHIEQAKATKPTKYRAGKNIYPVRCDMCSELYFVDERIIGRVYSAFGGDRSSTPFTCEMCEMDFAEAS